MIAFIQKYAMYVLGVALAIAVVAFGVQTIRLKDAQLEMSTHLEKDARAQTDAVAQAKALGERVTQAVNDAATQYEKGKADAQEAGKSVTAQLNTGVIRVRTVWKCPAGRVDMPKDAATPGESGDAERQRNESAGRIVGAARSCDAQVAGLIKAYSDAMKLINHE